MFAVQSAPSSGPPRPLIANFWDACPFLGARGGAEGIRGGIGDGRHGSSIGGSTRLLRCFLSLPSSSLSPPSAAVDDSRNSRRRRSRSAKERHPVHGAVACQQVSSSGPTTASAATPAPETLPGWIGRLGLDEEEEEDLVAAFAALPEPPPPAAADAKLVQATRELVVSMKGPKTEHVRQGKPKRRGRPRKNPSLVEVKESSESQQRRDEKEMMRIEAENLANASKVAETKELLNVPVEATAKSTTEERGRWIQERLLLNDATLAKMMEFYPQCVSYRIVENLEPKLEWLQKELGLDDQALGKMISTAPVILG
ncbi:unnamed protein product, partial [Ectocarpus sp. 8 AP-2014]